MRPEPSTEVEAKIVTPARQNDEANGAKDHALDHVGGRVMGAFAENAPAELNGLL
jgi:hypothetical protein